MVKFYIGNAEKPGTRLFSLVISGKFNKTVERPGIKETSGLLKNLNKCK